MATYSISAPSAYAALAVPGFLVYKNGSSGGRVDYTAPHAVTAVLPWVSAALAFPFKHRFAVRRFNGAWEDLTTQEIALELDAAGNRVIRPLAPDSLDAVATAGGGATVTAQFDVKAGTPKPDRVRLYGDGGTGTVNWAVPLQDIAMPYEGGLVGRAQIAFTVAGLVTGTTYLFGIRSRVLATGAESDNTDTASVVGDAALPGPVAAVSAGAAT